MRTIKWIDKSIMATEQHNPSICKIVKLNIDGENKTVASPYNIDLKITNVCNNKCFYCSSHEDLDEGDSIYFSNLNKLLESINRQGLIRDVEFSISGGEPTLYPERLVKTMELVKAYGIKERTFSTTGQGLFQIVDGKPLCYHMVLNEFIHNISINRVDERLFKNREILSYGIDDDELEKVSTFFKMSGAELRISCGMIPGYVDDLDRMKKFVQYHDNMDIKHVIFRELTYEGEPLVDLKPIMEYIDHSLEFELIEEVKSNIYTIFIYEYKDKLIKCYEPKADN